MAEDEEIQFSSRRKTKTEVREKEDVPMVPSKPTKDFTGDTIVMLDGKRARES